MGAAAHHQAAAPLAHMAMALAGKPEIERRVHDMTLSPRLLAFCATPRTRGELVHEFGEKAPETCKNLVRRGALVNLGPGADGFCRFVCAEQADQHAKAQRRIGVQAQMAAALKAARACIQTDRVHLADSHMSPVSNEIDDEDALAALAEYDAVLRQIDEALERAGAQP